jgi:hypothetical protein
VSTNQHLQRREVRSNVPWLSPETNWLLTQELREAVGRDTVDCPPDLPASAERPHARHSPLVAALWSNRIGIIIVSLMLVIVGVIVSLAAGSWWALVAAVAVLALATLAVAASTLQLTTETEGISPTLAARLEEEGVGDPDKLFTELVQEFTCEPPPFRAETSDEPGFPVR